MATAWGDRKHLQRLFQGLVPKPGGAFAFEMRTSGVPTMLARIGVMRALNRDASACSIHRENSGDDGITILRKYGAKRCEPNRCGKHIKPECL